MTDEYECLIMYVSDVSNEWWCRWWCHIYYVKGGCDDEGISSGMYVSMYVGDVCMGW